MEILDRWQQREFRFLYSLDTLAEYAEKLLARGIPAPEVGAFPRLLARHGACCRTTRTSVPIRIA